MHTTKLTAAAISIAAVLFFTSCFKTGEIQLVSKNFETEVEQQQNLIFTFDKDLVPDSLIAVWDTIPYIRFSPEVKGKFKWNNRNELMFSPLSGFNASTEYTAALQNTLSVHSSQSYSIGTPKTITFHTPYLRLTEANGYWTISRKNQGEAALMISLLFNYKMDPGTVQSLLHLTMNGKSSQFEISTSSVDKKITLLLDGIAKEEVTQVPVKIELAKGLRSVESKYETPDAITMDVVIPSPAKLDITSVTGEFIETEAMIHVYTTQAVDQQGLKSMLILDPKISIETELTENGFLLKGLFTAGQNYSLIIKKELKGVLGGGLDKDYQAQVSFGQMEPSIAFVNQKGLYLSSKSSKNIAVNVVNIPKVNVTVYRIFENNIEHYLREGRYRDYWYDDEGYNDGGYNYNTYDMQYYGKAVFKKEYETKDLARSRGVNLLNLSFQDEIAFKGIYLVSVASTTESWKGATKLVSVSDIGLITKKSDDELYVFANSIKTTEPLSNLKVSLVSRNNQNVLSATTNGEGVAVFSNLRQRLADFTLEMITARDGNDFNYLMLKDASVNASRFDVGGRRANSTGLMAFVYGDRDIYRPGETIHLNTIVRNEQWQMQPEMPLKIKILLPNGREYKNIRASLNKQGAFATSVDLPVSAVTGNYIAQVFTSNDVLIESKNISVEEFMPDRIDVKLNLGRESMGAGDTMKVTLTALNMFGPPAADRKYEIAYNINRRIFNPKDYPGYTFEVKTDNKTSFSPNDVIEGKTDENGNAVDVFSSKEEWKDQGVLGGKIFATVFDETGRPVNRVKTFDIFTQNIFYGMKVSDRYVDRGVQLVIPMVAVDKKGKPKATRAQVQVVRFDWYSVVEQDQYGGRYRYVSKKKDIVLLDQVVSFPATGYAFSFIPRESGEYEVRVKDPESERYVAEEFYSYGWGYTSNTSFEVSTEGQVDIKPDKEKYKPGEEATLVFTAPFNGKLLVTVECDKVIEYHFLHTDKKSAMMKLPIKETYMPNVYITATLFRPLDDGSIPLTVGHGFVPLMVEKDGTKLSLTIVAPEKSRSKTKQLITVKTSPQQNIEITIAVVDEGILALKNYQTPAPHEFFYQKKALNVDAYDLYPFLLPDLQWSRSSPGGDGYNMEKRVNPLTNKRVKLVALWSGILHTNSNGEASYTIDIPQFSGDLRVMACAYKGKSFGSADKHIKVADPIVISPSIPRFLSPKDTLSMPVTLTNTTAKQAEATAMLALKGGLKVAGNETQTVSIRPNSEQRVHFKVVAGDVIGNGSITVNVNAMNEKFSDHTDITIRPATSLTKISGSGEITKSKTIELKHDFIPSTMDARLVISSNPMAQFSKALQYLVGYPHGCIEQTTSKAFPQIYFSELAKNMKYTFATDLNPSANVQAAVNKLQAMQQYSGGMSYWPGSSDETWWGTTYATHFLIEAKKAGYDVNAGVIDKAMNYMSQKVKGHTSEDYYYDWDYSNWKVRRIYSKENYYSLYLMALYGKADISSMNFYKANLDQAALDSRYMLACTYLAVGDRKSYDQLLPKVFEGERSRNSFGGSFYSYLRDMAISLNVLLETDPENPQIPELVLHLSRQMNAKEWVSTQEAAYSFLALGKFMKRINTGEKITANVLSNGNRLADFNGKDLTLKKGIAGQSLQVSINGNGKLFYYWEIEGLSAKGEIKEEDNYLMVRKTFYDRFGRSIDINKVSQGDLIVVKATLTNLERSKIENIVVTDMLPAGFEIDNPRISDQQGMEWIKDRTEPAYFDVRDDRINFFTTIESKPQNFYYLVRAVSTGNYRMGPISADAMYNGEYHSYHGATNVRITD